MSPCSAVSAYLRTYETNALKGAAGGRAAPLGLERFVNGGDEINVEQSEEHTCTHTHTHTTHTHKHTHTCGSMR